MTEAEARKQFRTALRACIAQEMVVLLVVCLVVTPLAGLWPWLIPVVVGVALLWTGWANGYMKRWEYHLQWCRRWASAEAAGDTITLLGLVASPDANRPKMWPAFWFRWWGIKP